MKSLLERFNKHWTPEPFSGCWLWTASGYKKGYGQVNVNKGNVAAHRLAYNLFKGQIPSKAHVLHRCDTPSCVNPDHLFLGTDLDNKRDAWSKGRLDNTGERNGMSKLTKGDVVLIRNSKKTYSQLAKEFNTTSSNISRIKNYQGWRHL